MWVEACGRLVEEHDVWLVDQCPGDAEPPLHAARQLLDLVVGPLPQLHEVEQFGRPLPGHRAGNAEVPRVHREVFRNGDFGVERVLLRTHAKAGPDAWSVAYGIEAEDAQRPPARRRHTPDHAHGGGLARAVGTEETEGLARVHIDVDAVHSSEVSEPLHESTGGDQRLASHAMDRNPTP